MANPNLTYNEILTALKIPFAGILSFANSFQSRIIPSSSALRLCAFISVHTDTRGASLSQSESKIIPELDA
jgi:hypothetical protein